MLSLHDWPDQFSLFAVDHGTDGATAGHAGRQTMLSAYFPFIGVIDDGSRVDISPESGRLMVLVAASDVEVTITPSGDMAGSIPELFVNSLHKTAGLSLTIDDPDGIIGQTFVRAGDGDDSINATLDGSFRINTGDGNDTATVVRTYNLIDAYPLHFSAILGGAGDDHISYTAEWTNLNDSDPGIAHTAISGGLGNDSIDVSLNGGSDTDFGALRVVGGSGADEVHVYLNTSLYDAQIDSYSVSATVSGGRGNDKLVVDLPGGAGDGSTVNVSGGGGNDSIDVSLDGSGDFGNLVLNGGAGNDRVLFNYNYFNNASVDTRADHSVYAEGSISGGAGDDNIALNIIRLQQGRALTDADFNEAHAVVSGNAGNDSIEVALEGEGNFGNLRIMGNAGNDDIYMHYELEDVLVTSYSVSGSVYGGAGNDRLFVDGGGAPADGAKMVVSGGAGNDLIVNNLATARVYGGSQSDTFVLAEGGNAGTIMDYTDGKDHIGLTTGLCFDHLAIYEAGGETFIAAETGGAVLVTLDGLHAGELDSTDFVEIPGDTTLV